MVRSLFPERDLTNVNFEIVSFFPVPSQQHFEIGFSGGTRAVADNDTAIDQTGHP